MRIKAIPEEAVEFASKNPLLLIGVAGIGIVGYVYINSKSAVAPDADVAASNAQPSYGSYGLAPLSTGGIVSTLGGGTGGVVDSLSNTYAQQAVADAAAAKDYDLKKSMFDFEVKKNDQSNALAWAQLNGNLAVAALNADIAFAGIQASNYQTSTALATSFLMSGKSIAMGSVVAPDGSVTQFGLTAYDPDSSKKGKETTRYQQVLASTGFKDFVNNISAPKTVSPPVIGVSPNVAQSGTGSGSATAYASAPFATPVQSRGSTVVASVNGGLRNNGEPALNIQ